MYKISTRQNQPKNLKELLEQLQENPEQEMIVIDQETKLKYVKLGVPEDRIRVIEFDKQNPPHVLVDEIPDP